MGMYALETGYIAGASLTGEFNTKKQSITLRFIPAASAGNKTFSEAKKDFLITLSYSIKL